MANRKTDASIAFSVTDNLSQSVTRMRNSLDGFKQDVEGLQKQLDILQRTKVQLKNIDLKQAKSQVDEMRRALEELGDTATETERQTAQANFDAAVQNYNNVANQLDLVSRRARQTQKDLLNTTDAISKADNRASSVSSGGSMLAALGRAGLLSMAGDVALDAGNLLIGSAFGSETGGALSSGISGALSGAAMGSLGGPIAAAIGAAVGGGLGLIQGGIQAASSRDEAFKNYYSGLYEQGQTESQETLTSGSATAAQRELDAIAFERLLYGQGDEFLEGLRETAARTPFEYGDLTTMARNLATGFGTDPSRMLELMTAIGDAGAAVGASTSDMQWMATALSRMQSTDLAQLGEINMFQDRGVDVIGMLADALGVSEGDVRSMITGGKISGRRAVDIIQTGLSDPDGTYAGSMDLMAETFEGLTSTLSDAMTEIEAARGEGYNAMASQGLQADVDAYGGALGEALAQANSIIGEGQAIAENLARQYDREALEAVTLG
ncbi:tape measure protein, partial [Dysosmobacter sp.]|uniref:tape measure protein n=1 Tax=Dysosmobacter sp. TaxID=2591382 RepID=UPI003AB3C42E